ncbi:MAG: rod-binding protein [Spirochaetaceae bacterium]|jgi:flagellar protein FlgJ|nr:rod-binding protein [Spirochaetaceae bacterium]
MSIEALGSANIDNARYDVSRFEHLRPREKAGPEAAAETRDFAAMLGAVKIEGKDTPVVDKDDKLYEQCEALEMFFLKTILTGMRKTVEKAELNKTGFAGEMYEDMLWDEYAKDFSKNAGFGFAELAYLELTGQRGKVIDRLA